MTLPTQRYHRTALVIDVRQGADGAFKERYKRLLQSVNGQNIKVDVFTLNENGLVAGAPDDVPPQPTGEIDLKAWANDLGYTQLLVSVPVKSVAGAAPAAPVVDDDEDDDEDEDDDPFI